MNRSGITFVGVIITAVTVVLTLLVSPFLFDLLNVSGLSGVEGFFAKLVPFVMLWFSLRVGAYRAVGE